jgi:hypothetical protein
MNVPPSRSLCGWSASCSASPPDTTWPALSNGAASTTRCSPGATGSVTTAPPHQQRPRQAELRYIYFLTIPEIS